ncbi:unnamed protein product [Symbiodinium necroappetens]|uniref:Reverse transcriptase domain-containing protein n=1 Tax=Symbiodinium necroappetens TaxID=1628268 RepID=A0A812PR13_9DINO|nr:unnamed protein product [Symbiodinium necroappetens]
MTAMKTWMSPGGATGASGEQGGQAGSPKRQKGGGESGVVTMDALRSLLAEQSVSLLQAQQLQMTTALTAFEERQVGRLEKLEQKVGGQSDAVSDLQTQVQDLAERLAKVENRPQSAVGSGPDRRSTLVFGGWGMDTRRSTLLHQLDQALLGLQIKGDFDSDPFTTGARRSVALCQFKRRHQESDQDMKQRMLRIMQVINASQVNIQGATRPLWCSFSKSPEERGRAALAAAVRKAVLKVAPHRATDLDVEYPSGKSWIRDDQLSGMGQPPSEIRQARVVATKGGEGEEGEVVAELQVVSAETVEPFRMRVVGWNVGGTDLVELPKAVREALGEPLRKQDIVLIQEMPREREGWNYMPLAGRRVVSHRRESQWRGTGMWYDTSVWCLLRKVHSSKGVWFKVRHLEAPIELWIRTAHFTPGCSVSQYEEEVQDHFDGVPPSSHRVVFQGDVNTGFTWAREGDVETVVPKEGKGGILHKLLTEKNLVMGIPSSEQWVNHMDQSYIEHLANRCTKPVPGQGYRDTTEIKQAFRAAKRSGSSELWKQALKLRKEARRAWEQARLVKASQGDWHSFRALKPRRQEGWDVGFAEAQQGDPHEAVHEHLSQVYCGTEVEAVETPWQGDVVAFTTEELRRGVSQMKRGKSVGIDRTSTELLLGLMEVPGGEQHLLEWFNRILATQCIPDQWNKPILIMLPKIRAPKKAKELRPIAMGSGVSKLFSRMLLNRAMPALPPTGGAQCSGPGRQTCDYLYTVIRLFELAREWGVPLTVFELDLEKAFDSLDRPALLRKLEAAIGVGSELNCWKGLLRGTVGQLQTPWGSTEVRMMRGIKQGAVESPAMFAWIAEIALNTAVQKYGWHQGPRLLEGLVPEEMLYMDDGMLWGESPATVQVRACQLAVELSAFGLRLNPQKCQLYAPAKVTEDRSILLNGTRVIAADTLEVMGLTLRVGGSICELAAPLASRARAKFWDHKHIFRSRGGSMKQRARVMQRVVGNTALWCICCLPPDAATMTMLNSVQLQLMVWLLRFAKRADEPWESL